MLRSCYRCKMRFYNDDPVETPVEWYMVADDAPILPYWSAFGSRIYERDDEPEPKIGERYEPHPWKNWQAPKITPTGGLCGSPDEWFNGISVTLPVTQVWPGTEVPVCCNEPPGHAMGGAGPGGTFVCVGPQLPTGGGGSGGTFAVLSGKLAVGGAAGGGSFGVTVEGSLVVEGGAAGGGSFGVTVEGSLAFEGGAAGGGSFETTIVESVTSEGGSAGGGTFYVRFIMDTTFDVYRPFGSVTPDSTDNPCRFFEDFADGRSPDGATSLQWTHYLTCDQSVSVLDGVTRTDALNTLNYYDGDEVRIPTGGTSRYVVVWVTPDVDSTGDVWKVFLMRHSF